MESNQNTLRERLSCELKTLRLLLVENNLIIEPFCNMFDHCEVEDFTIRNLIDIIWRACQYEDINYIFRAKFAIIIIWATIILSDTTCERPNSAENQSRYREKVAENMANLIDVVHGELNTGMNSDPIRERIITSIESAAGILNFAQEG